MSALVLTLKSPPALRVDASRLAPERLDGLKAGEIARLTLSIGNQSVPVGDVFAVTGDDPADLRLRGVTEKFDFLGRGMKRGRLTIEGNAGAYLGRGMSGGEIALDGHAGPWAACAMSGGRMTIAGNAGEGLGRRPARGPLRHERRHGHCRGRCR
jgi:formylmethanofuran dehydrogenase subunit C